MALEDEIFYFQLAMKGLIDSLQSWMYWLNFFRETTPKSLKILKIAGMIFKNLSISGQTLLMIFVSPSSLTRIYWISFPNSKIDLWWNFLLNSYPNKWTNARPLSENKYDIENFSIFWTFKCSCSFGLLGSSCALTDYFYLSAESFIYFYIVIISNKIDDRKQQEEKYSSQANLQSIISN